MRKEIKRLFIMGVATMAMMSCQSGKQAALQDLRNLTAEVEANATSYNFRQWIQEEKKYQRIDSRLQKYEYTNDELHEIGELKGTCLGYFAKGVIGKASNKIMDAANQLQGIVDGIQKVLVP